MALRCQGADGELRVAQCWFSATDAEYSVLVIVFLI